MKIIASSNDSFIIEATKEEVREILQSVNGKNMTLAEINIGQKIPAIDYSTTLRKLKSMKTNGYFQSLLSATKAFNQTMDNLAEKVDDLSKIEE